MARSVALMISPAPAFAHSEGTGSGLMAGLFHPLMGADHLLAMLAVGIVSVRMGGASIWRVPAAFVTAMAAGAWLGFGGWTLPVAEAGIASSVTLLGLAIAWDRFERFAHAVFSGVFLFGLCHGNAHGVELPRAAVPIFYSTGFLISTIFIHVCGIFIGEFASDARWRAAVLRVFGLTMAGAGVWFGWR